jgi:rSAM/selenodomain-associated transferase 1
MARKPRLVVFVRAPVLGAVKRRLAAGIGMAAARSFYVVATRGLLNRIGHDPRWRTEIWVTPDAAARSGRFWERALPRIGQGHGGLGRRMARALTAGGSAPTVIVGSDIPDIEARHIEAAFRALARNDAVFGPADDGGYWLVGVRDRVLARNLFKRVRWSGPHALADTLANLPGKRVAMLEVLADIDNADDLANWRKTRE